MITQFAGNCQMGLWPETIPEVTGELLSLQAVCVAVGLFFVMPKILSPDAVRILKPNRIFLVGLAAAFLVFAYFCIFQIPSALFALD